MKQDISVHINGKHHLISGADSFSTLSDFLRNRLRLVGTKIMCSEGDCGACTVLIGRSRDARSGAFVHHDTDTGTPQSSSSTDLSWEYQSVDSCIQFMFQLEGTHVVTIEGLKSVESPCQVLTPIQQSLIDHQGSQCGYCTPGFVMSLAGMRESKIQLESHDIREGLSGNLCRCTGYVAIEEAASDECFSHQKVMADSYCHDAMNTILDSRSKEDVLIELSDSNADSDVDLTTGESTERIAFMPASLEQALTFLARHPRATVIAGASDVGVWHCKSGFHPKCVLCINRIAELQTSYAPDDLFNGMRRESSLILGASLNWESIREACRGWIPQFDSLLSLFGSPQIRHVGTIGGNIVNGSPIADSLPILFALDARLRLASTNENRWVPINQFYTGYKKNVMQPGELLTHVELPIPKAAEVLKLYKVSRRRDMDISTFTAAIALELQHDSVNGTKKVDKIRVALGGVGPLVVRAPKTEAFLMGREWCESVAAEAGAIAATEVAPITDVRGSEKYRRTLTKNIFQRFFFETSLDCSKALQI
jgi:xanthine dehydrogenase small subunit